MSQHPVKIMRVGHAPTQPPEATRHIFYSGQSPLFAN
jgi:hypothetical protein